MHPWESSQRLTLPRLEGWQLGFSSYSLNMPSLRSILQLRRKKFWDRLTMSTMVQE